MDNNQKGKFQVMPVGSTCLGSGGTNCRHYKDVDKSNDC